MKKIYTLMVLILYVLVAVGLIIGTLKGELFSQVWLFGKGENAATLTGWTYFGNIALATILSFPILRNCVFGFISIRNKSKVGWILSALSLAVLSSVLLIMFT